MEREDMSEIPLCWDTHKYVRSDTADHVVCLAFVRRCRLFCLDEQLGALYLLSGNLLDEIAYSRFADETARPA